MLRIKQILAFLAICVVACYLSEYFRIFLVAVESLPVYLEHIFEDMLNEGGINVYMAYGSILWITSLTYSGVLLGAYWLMNRRLPRHDVLLVLGVWFIVYVVMALGPETLAL